MVVRQEEPGREQNAGQRDGPVQRQVRPRTGKRVDAPTEEVPAKGQAGQERGYELIDLTPEEQDALDGVGAALRGENSKNPPTPKPHASD